MIVGFTGTQLGMNGRQLSCIIDVFEDLTVMGSEIEFHHGDCIGADEQAHSIAVKFGFRTIGHPPLDDSKRAFTINDQNLPPLPYKERNFAIVDATILILATPLRDIEELRSGTWQTLRYAKRMNRERKIFGPTIDIDF